MGLKTYLTFSNYINEEIKRLQHKKVELDKQAYQEHLFEVEIEELIQEIQKTLQQSNVTSQVNVYFDSIVLPKEIKTIDEAKEYIAIYKPPIGIHFYDRDLLTKGLFATRISIPLDITTKTSDGKRVLDHIIIQDTESVFGNQEAIVPKSLQRKLIINLDPSAEYFRNTVLNYAIFNCVKNKEKSQKTQKNKQK